MKKRCFFILPILSISLIFLFSSSSLFGQVSFGNLSDKPETKKENSKKKSEAAADDAERQERSKAAEPVLGAAREQKFRYGMCFEARPGGECTNIFGSIPIPIDWPEQRVRVIEEDFPNGARIGYRDLKEGGCRELVFKMNRLKAGQKIEASVILEIIRSEQSPPAETASLKIPKRVPKELRIYLRESPYIETDNRHLRKWSKELTEGIDSDWAKVEAVYRGVREAVKYKEAYVEKSVRGAYAAYDTGEGDCEDMSCLFIALLRNLDIPARTVRVPEHCWAEFYLEDADGTGHWYPAQIAGNEALGVSASAQAMQPILQKGDAFTLPESPRETTRYVKEIFTGDVVKNGPNPKYEFIQEKADR